MRAAEPGMTFPPWPLWPPWRALIGPIVTLVTAGGILLLEKYLIRVPTPGAMTFLVVAFAAYLGGLASGLVSAGISLAFAAVYFSEPGELLRFTPDNLARMLVLAICTPAMAIMMG